MTEAEIRRVHEEYRRAKAAVERVLRAYERAIGVDAGEVTSWAPDGDCFVIETTGHPSEYRLPVFWAELPSRILDAHAQLEAANRRIELKRKKRELADQ